MAEAGSGFGAVPDATGTRFDVWSGSAESVWLCLYEGSDDTETRRLALSRDADGVFSAHIDGLRPGLRYGVRADGPHDPAQGHWFDPAKLLVDPYAIALDRPFAYDPRLAAPHAAGIDTAALVPKAVVTALPPPVASAPPHFSPGGFIYELNVRSFSLRHPEVPPALRGTVAALAHPAILDHLTRLGVDAIELMPIAAWIDERHLPRLGLRNSWGYNPVTMMALDPRLCPGAMAELRETVAALHGAGIGVILDVVFNHTGESDAAGPTLSLRGLDAQAYYAHDAEGRLINDTGCGNTLDCAHPAMRRLVLDSLRHFVRHAGIDGFRFDLAPVLGRLPNGFDPNAPLLQEIIDDPVLADRMLIAEPWDIGPGGYRLGGFPAQWLEWNDRYRDRVRRFWRGDARMRGDLATALAGSSDVFAGERTRSVNFIAAHDGFALADLVAYRDRHNLANGEENRDGHGENLSWNNGTEGASDDAAVTAARAADLRALLATLFASRGTILMTAGDEFGRSQGGNNNAYAQDGDLTWLDWAGRDRALEDFTADLAALRRRFPALAGPGFLTGAQDGTGTPDVVWTGPEGEPLTVGDWQAECDTLGMILSAAEGRLAVLFNRGSEAVRFDLPGGGSVEVAARSVRLVPDEKT